MKNSLIKQQDKKTKPILLQETATTNDDIIVSNGIRIERDLSISTAQPNRSGLTKQRIYDDQHIYFHFIIDADIRLFTPRHQYIGHMETNKVYQMAGANRTVMEENHQPHEKQITFIISVELLDKWQQNYQIPEWLDYTKSDEPFFQSICLGRHHKRIMLLVEQLIRMDIHTLSDRLSFKSCALSICSSIFQQYSISKNQHFVDEVLFMLHQDPLMKWTLNDLAKHVGTNECYLKQEFKNKMGISIGRYMRNLRMQEALELIINHQLSTKEAAYKVGYTDVGYFARIFKQKYGYTPSDIALSTHHKRP
ncbi:MAG: helix-turn-helix transcriptional regulator [Neisseriaceae bacterium]|nr:helix-turn-helix transcriptional regulator [Neisseriaceae bacterium]